MVKFSTLDSAVKIQFGAWTQHEHKGFVISKQISIYPVKERKLFKELRWQNSGQTKKFEEFTPLPPPFYGAIHSKNNKMGLNLRQS